MPGAISLHIGLNSVDPAHYQGWSGPLNACEADARTMEHICASRGFTTKVLLTAAATRKAVLGWLDKAAKSLEAGDIALISYSGHGGQLPDLNRDEDDGLDETWCLFDGELVDDEIYAAWSQFAAGVRVVFFSDSCHSGTVAKTLERAGRSPFLAGGPDAVSGVIGPRVMPIEIQRATYEAGQVFYDELLTRNPPASDPVCSVIQVSGCQDNQLSMDGAFNGAFTGALSQVWANASFRGNYAALTKAVRAKLPTSQSPNYLVLGAPNPAFEKQEAFTTFPLNRTRAKGAVKELKVQIEAIAGVRSYSFDFAGAAVPIRNDVGKFNMEVGSEDYLYWSMLGDPGGSMKVTVFDGETIAAQRLKSTIPNSSGGGFDRLKLKI